MTQHRSMTLAARLQQARPWTGRPALCLAQAIVLTTGLLAACPSRAQIAPTTLAAGRGVVSSFMARMVRISGRASGYGFVIGSREMPGGGSQLMIVTADHLVRDPTSTAPPPPVDVTFYGNLAISLRADVLAQHLSPDQGDLAVLVTERPLVAKMPSATMASTQALSPGSPAWEIGRPGVWDSPGAPGQFSIRLPSGWLLFDGLDAERGSAGGAVVNPQGLVGMVVGEAAGPAAAIRVLPIELIAAKLAEWELKWDVTVPVNAATAKVAASGGLAALTFSGGSDPKQAMPDPTATGAGGVSGARAATQQASLGKAPMAGLIPLLASDAAARRSWVPTGARLSPAASVSTALLSSPRREAPPIGALPPGRILPAEVWIAGAYDLIDKLDGGAWFLVGSEGQPLGYVVGEDMIEIWPAAVAAPTGRVVRDWVPANAAVKSASTAERHAVLRDAGQYYDLTVPVTCAAAYCNMLQFYTPGLPAPGGILPAFHVPPITGSWSQNQVVEVHIQLPRRVVETKGTRLLACIGQAGDCAEQQILP